MKKGVKHSTEMLENLNFWYYKVVLMQPEMHEATPSEWWLFLLLKGEMYFSPLISGLCCHSQEGLSASLWKI